MKPWSNQLDNRNYLSPVGFKFSITKIPKVDFFSNSTSIPGINLGYAVQSTYLKDIPVPGDKLTYQDFSLSFFVDENLTNYLEVHNWIRALGFPESVDEFTDLKEKDKYNPSNDARNPLNEYSDASLFIYNSAFNEVARIDFQNVFPVSLSTINFDATNSDINYVSAEATFKYSIYNIEVL
jgi:hypothetical protein